MSKRSALTFDRWDFLGTRVLLAVIGVAVTVFGVVGPLVDWLRGEPLRWTVLTGRPTPLSSAEVTAKAGVDLSWPGEIAVSMPDPSAGTRLVALLPGLLVALATVIVVISLMRLLSHIQSGDDFGRAGLHTLRLVGATLLIGALLVSLAGTVANVVILDASLALSGDTASFQLDLGATVVVAAAGLVCAALAEAFGHLADDVEGLI